MVAARNLARSPDLLRVKEDQRRGTSKNGSSSEGKVDQDQRRSSANIITSRTQTANAEEEAQRRRQEGDQRSHQEALGGETGRSSVKADRRKEGGVEEVGQQEARKEVPEDFGNDCDRHRPINCAANCAIANPNIPGLGFGARTQHFVPSS